MITFLKETLEFQPVSVKLDGVAVTTGVKFSVVLVVDNAAVPGTWITATSLDGKIGFMVDNLDTGYYRVFAQITDNPEIPVKKVGTFRVTDE